MCLYAVSLQPLITRLNASTFVKQFWFADDATGAGCLGELKKWLDVLNESGPSLGYFPNAKKVLSYGEARERRGSEGSSVLVKHQLTSPLRVKSV